MRREVDVTVTAEGRDKGKSFHIKEMPAAQAEEWAMRVFLALMRGGAEIPDDVAEAGLAGLATLGLKAFQGLRWEDAKPLVADMMRCVTIRPDPEKHPDILRALIDEDIEEVETRLRLKVEVFNLHTGFSLAGGLST